MTTVEMMRWWHVAAVAELESQLFPRDPWTVEQFWQELAQETRYYVVALSGGEVVGYAGAFVLAPDGDVQTIGVGAASQGSGTGARLLESILEEAARRGVTHVMLEVRSDNASALALYERFGFERISVRHRYYPDGADALIMRCRLGRGGGLADPAAPGTWQAGRHG
jgi:[ribosomal protein S18]-alanine N-acetyltransferase